VTLRGLAGACVALLAALAAAGCGTVGTGEGGAASRGQELFVEGCGSCHVLADAGTQGTIGPNLDDGFRQAREDGLGEDTIRSVVRGQIAYPVENPVSGAPGMPADIFTGDDADAVAAYVASVAGLPVVGGGGTDTGGTDTGGTDTGGTDTGGTDTGGTDTGGTDTGGDGDQPDGEAIFAQSGCGSCHTLDAAGASGTIGPNLDETQPSREVAIDRITNGQGAMPAFGDQLSEEQIAAVADYVVENAGGR
jgi:mono/diheme cytochrome c family protein